MKRNVLSIVTALALTCSSWMTYAVDFERYDWKQQGQTASAWIDPNTRAKPYIEGQASMSVKQAKANTTQGKFVFYDVPPVAMRHLTNETASLPVLRAGPSPNAPYMVPVGGVIVATEDESTLKVWTKRHGLTLQSTGVTGYWLVKTAPGQAALEAASRLSEVSGVTTAYPNWATAASTR